MLEEKKELINDEKSDNNDLLSEENLVTLKLTHQEVQVLVNLIDIAVRARGLDVAGNAAIIHDKIKKSFSFR